MLPGCLLYDVLQIRMPKPDTEGRYDILRLQLRNKDVAADVDLLQLARDLPGLVGADLGNIVNEAQLNGRELLGLRPVPGVNICKAMCMCKAICPTEACVEL